MASPTLKSSRRVLRERENNEAQFAATALTPSLYSARKLRVVNPISWEHHRGGWKHVVQLITNHLHAPDGVRFVSAVDDELYHNGSIKEPWVGFLHQVPHQELRFPDLSRLIHSQAWRESIKYCQGLWVLCDYYRRFLLDNDVAVPISKVYYPTQPPESEFAFDRFRRNRQKRLLCIGEFLRKYQPFFDLEVEGYEKVLIKHRFLDSQLRRQFVEVNDSVQMIEPVTDEEYDSLLANNIVFLNLSDAGANTTVIECIASGTPILINNVGAVSEYLGGEYPFYYRTLDEATKKLRDNALIRETSNYLKKLKVRKQLTDSSFLSALQNTTVYRSLPVPPSQQTQFKSFDLSLVMCAYKRTHNLRKQLTLLSRQDFEGTFEVILWNNNRETVDEINNICRDFEDSLNLKVIHSCENFYCIIRLAVTSLMRSDLLLICDDDVLPQKSYISTFLNKYREYGPEAAICARGHIFLPHRLDEDAPEAFWQTGKAMKFFDERQPDVKLHFLHADNTLIPKKIMKRALQEEMPNYEFALVDDYWLSFVLSHRMNIPIWKIKANHILKFTDCADDPQIAMFHNSRVNEQRTNFYIYHMRQGWPSFGPERRRGIWDWD
jgi:glycosyltransferase involved in cell wall biosynthesis